MQSATRITASTFGVVAGLAGIEHGIGEVLQGNVAPEAIVIKSWPDSGLFDILGGEPAMTIVPNLLVTGVLAIIVSLALLVWAAAFVQRKNGGLVLVLLSVLALPVGAGFGPPILGAIAGLAGTKINAPLTWWRTHLSLGTQRFLTAVWPWSFAVCVVAWLLLLPGSIIIWHFLPETDPNLVLGLILIAFGSLPVTILLGVAYDSQRQTEAGYAPVANEAAQA